MIKIHECFKKRPTLGESRKCNKVSQNLLTPLTVHLHVNGVLGA